MRPAIRCVALLILLSAAAPAGATELLVHAAASLQESLGEIAALHEARTGVKVSLDLGSSGTLARQILEGAPGDVFFSADEEKMNQLARAKRIDPATRRSALSNALVLVVAKDAPGGIACTTDLASPAVKRVALADPASVPAGIYAMEHLRRIGVWGVLAPKIMPAENVRGALAAVEAGNADAAIVYATDARVSTNVRVACTVPADQAPDISYPVAALSGSEHPAEARAFVAFLSSPQATAVFERFGFLVRR